VSTQGFQAQFKVIQKYGHSAPSQLSRSTQPTLIGKGDPDRMVPSVLSNDLHRRVRGSQLLIYPNSGHGGIFQYHEKFAPIFAGFLDHRYREFQRRTPTALPLFTTGRPN
jgi:pimeloyl-ACP methyl ester carboxylesterase